MSEHINSAENIKVISIAFYSERFDPKYIFVAGDATAAPTAAEIVIYEDIMKPYLTASLIFQDDQDFGKSIKGTEKVIVVLQSPGDKSQVIQKEFVVRSVEFREYITDTQAILKINLIENYGYFDHINRFNLGYADTGENIIEKISTNIVGASLFKDIKDSYQGAFRYIVPWITPFKAIKKVLSKMTTRTGLPYFYFSSLNTEFHNLTDLETILEKGTINKGTPFIYSRGNTSADISLDLLPFIVEYYEAEQESHSLFLAELGTFGSKISSINASTSLSYNTKINMAYELKLMEDAGVFERLGSKQQLNVFDTFFRAIDDFDKADIDITEFNSRVFYSIDSRTNDQSLKSPDRNLLGYNESLDEADTRLSIIRLAVLRYLVMNAVTIKVPGLFFSIKSLDTSVGNLIEFAMFENEKTLNERLGYNDDRSGQFIILKKKHVIDLTSDAHTVQMDISKIANLEARSVGA
tara:strand:+ start:11018 stop:12418 length:1401 start_codon:yes stop_codon:yes gene_type:complete